MLFRRWFQYHVTTLTCQFSLISLQHKKKREKKYFFVSTLNFFFFIWWRGLWMKFWIDFFFRWIILSGFSIFVASFLNVAMELFIRIFLNSHHDSIFFCMWNWVLLSVLKAIKKTQQNFYSLIFCFVLLKINESAEENWIKIDVAFFYKSEQIAVRNFQVLLCCCMQ